MKQYALLSDAILDGAKLSDPGKLLLVNHYGETCALGAAIHAIQGFASDNFPLLEELFHAVLTCRVECPVVACPFENVDRMAAHVITHLNDDHEWTRRGIAAWVSTIEEKLGMVELVSDESLINTTTTEREAEIPEVVAIASY